jgi:Flp pilus assembly protein TadB
MNEALRRFKKDRPEEYQEYQGYKLKYRQLNLQLIVACVLALSVVVGCIYLWNVVIASSVALIAMGALIWLYRSQSHMRSTLRLSMALMQLTFDDPCEVSSERKEELANILDKDEPN